MSQEAPLMSSESSKMKQVEANRVKLREAGIINERECSIMWKWTAAWAAMSIPIDLLHKPDVIDLQYSSKVMAVQYIRYLSTFLLVITCFVSYSKHPKFTKWGMFLINLRFSLMMANQHFSAI